MGALWAECVTISYHLRPPLQVCGNSVGHVTDFGCLGSMMESGTSGLGGEGTGLDGFLQTAMLVEMSWHPNVNQGRTAWHRLRCSFALWLWVVGRLGAYRGPGLCFWGFMLSGHA